MVHMDFEHNQGSPFYLSDFQNLLFFQYQIMYDLEE